MEIPWSIDLEDHQASGIRDFTRYHANGEREEVMSAVMDGIGPHGLYNVTDTVMCKMPTGVTPEEASRMVHEHRLGWETFFVDSGSMYLYVDGKRCVIREGDIVQLQPRQIHSMASMEDVKWRGFFHDLDSFQTSIAVNEVADRLQPGIKQDPAFQKAQGAKDHVRHEQPTFTDVPAETVNAVKNPARPLARFDFPGLTVKVIVPRWENGGVTELVLGEMAAGKKLSWGYHPCREQYYVRSGRVKLTLFGEERIAKAGCIINVPMLAPFTLEALEDAAVYDVGGQAEWFSFLLDYDSLRTYSPERLSEALPALMERCGVAVTNLN